MCGIMGFIGKSTNEELTYKLATKLLINSAMRGTDATGFFSVKNGKNHTYKYNIPSSKFVESEEWKEGCFGSDCLISHTRFTTCGPETNLINNHPHYSKDGTMALVHNGYVKQHKDIAEKNNVKLETECDSEIIIRLIEQEENVFDGIQRVFDEILESCGQFACLLVDTKEDLPNLYVFRSPSAPCLIINLKKELGQMFFCSTCDIWEKTVEEFPELLECKFEYTAKDEIWKINLNLKDSSMEEVKEKQVSNEDLETIILDIEDIMEDVKIGVTSDSFFDRELIYYDLIEIRNKLENFTRYAKE